jgi:hypothetical protein
MEKILDKKRKRKVYYFVLGEILNGLNELQRECKVDYNINAKESWFVLELSNGDKMTYISLDIFTIKEKIKSYLLKKYKIEMKNLDIEILKAEDEFSMLNYNEIEKYLNLK